MCSTFCSSCSVQRASRILRATCCIICRWRAIHKSMDSLLQKQLLTAACQEEHATSSEPHAACTCKIKCSVLCPVYVQLRRAACNIQHTKCSLLFAACYMKCATQKTLRVTYRRKTDASTEYPRSFISLVIRIA